MKKIVKWIINRFFNERFDLRVRLFNVLVMSSLIFCPVIAIISFFAKHGPVIILIVLVAALVSYLLLYYSSSSGHYRLCYLIFITLSFFILFPYLFFHMGGYHGGIPLFLVFAVVFTVFMLEDKTVLIVTMLELTLYIGMYLYAFRYPSSVSRFNTEKGYLISNTMDLVIVSVALSATMFAQISLYRGQQKKLEEQNAVLKQINLLKTEILGNVSHELKTPLTVVSGYAQTARKQLLKEDTGRDNKAIADKMKLISSEAERLALMVGQVLDVTRIEEGHMDIQRMPCHLDEIIHTAINTYYPILNKNQNQLTIRIDHGLPKIYADAARISQVMVNLISNAIRFTTNGSINISAKAKGAFVAISVSDTGTGISSEWLPFIFDRYNNNQKSGNGQDTGTGLGLFICKHIVEAHGGEITVESEKNKGTTVWFTVPAHKNQ